MIPGDINLVIESTWDGTGIVNQSMVNFIRTARVAQHIPRALVPRPWSVHCPKFQNFLSYSLDFPACSNTMSQNERNGDNYRTNEKLPLIGGSHSELTSNPTAYSWTVLKAIYFAAVACLGGLSFGLTVVFSSPLLDGLMRSNLTQWKEGFSTEECAYQILIGPISPIAAIVGGLLSAPLTAISGLVSGMILTAGVYLSGWTMVGSTYFITSPFAFRGLLLTGRALTGFAMGFSAASAPVSTQSVLL